MTSNTDPDPILRMLVQLPKPAPSSARDRRVRVRCHAVLACRGGSSTHRIRRRSILSRVIDAALAVGVSFYGALTFAEAIRLVGIR